jgi:hypothetical protein
MSLIELIDDFLKNNRQLKTVNKQDLLNLVLHVLENVETEVSKEEVDDAYKFNHFTHRQDFYTWLFNHYKIVKR